MSAQEILPATKADLPKLLKLFAQMDAEESLDIADAEAMLDRFALYPDYTLYAAWQQGEIVGVFSLLIMDNFGHLGTPSAIVEGVVVDSGHRGVGIGKKMMAFALDVAEKKGCYKLTLSSNMKREHAHAFYDSLGFQRHGYSFLMPIENTEAAA